MKVYVFTVFAAFGAERVLFVAKSKKTGEKQLRKMYPRMCNDGEHSYILDKKPQSHFNSGKPILGGVHEVELYG